MLTTSVIAMANTGAVTRQITCGIRINLNGQPMQLAADSQPFVMDGRTFLPVRAISEAVGMPVDFDSGTNTVFLGNRQTGRGVSLNQAAPMFDSGTFGGTVGHASRRPSSQILATAQMGGTSYSDVVVYRSAALSRPGRNGVFTLHNLNGRFRLLTGHIGRIDGSAMFNATVTISGDGNVLQTMTINATDMPVPISVFVEGVRQLRIEVEYAGDGNTLDNSADYGVAGFLE
jgi:hypothetical protein